MSTVRESMMQSYSDTTNDFKRSKSPSLQSVSLLQPRRGLQDSFNLKHTTRSNELLRTQMLSRLS